MSMIGEYWTIVYIHPHNGIDESHVLKVTGEHNGILTTEGFFLNLKRKFLKSTLESTIKNNGRPSTSEEIAAHQQAYSAS